MVIELKDSERTKCNVWTRSCGFIRPKSFFNIARTQAHKDMEFFKESVAIERCDK